MMGTQCININRDWVHCKPVALLFQFLELSLKEVMDSWEIATALFPDVMMGCRAKMIPDSLAFGWLTSQASMKSPVQVALENSLAKREGA